MTVGMKMHQCLASCESLVADMKTFDLETQDQQAKQMFNNTLSRTGRATFIASGSPC